MNTKKPVQKINPQPDPLADNTVEGFDDKDNAQSPQINPFRPDLPFDQAKVDKEKQVHRTTEW